MFSIFVIFYVYSIFHSLLSLWSSRIKVSQCIYSVTEGYVVEVIFAANIHAELLVQSVPFTVARYKVRDVDLAKYSPELRSWYASVVDSIVVFE